MTTITTAGYVGVAGRNEYFFTPTPVPNYVDGLDGNDVIDGFASADTLYGGLGRDIIFGAQANDTIYGDQFWNDETTNVNVLLAAEADMNPWKRGRRHNLRRWRQQLCQWGCR